MSTELIAFILKCLGVPNVGTNPVNRGQCVGLIEYWLQMRKLPLVGGNAKDLIGNADPHAYDRVTNTPYNHPPPGAVICWNGSWGNGYGHTAVVLLSTVMHVVAFEQNDPMGAPCLVATHDYLGVQGWFLPRSPSS